MYDENGYYIIISVSKQNLKTKKMSIFYEYSNFKDQSVYTQFLPDIFE